MSLQEVSVLLNELVGQPCCRQRVHSTNTNMLKLGFGDKVYHFRTSRIDNYSGEWELGTYNSEWQIVRGNTTLLKRADRSGSLDAELQKIELGSFVRFEHGENRVSVLLDNGITIDFFSVVDDDEFFHVFLPQYYYIQFSPRNDLAFGKSNVPWEPQVMSMSILP